MVNERKQKLCAEANEIIQKTMERRIPYYREIPADDNPRCVSQTDLYGYTDAVIQIASERLYHGQNKSRDESRSDIVIECRGYAGKPQNLVRVLSGITIGIILKLCCLMRKTGTNSPVSAGSQTIQICF